jgi:putative Holliday junction resolvase
MRLQAVRFAFARGRPKLAVGTPSYPTSGKPFLSSYNICVAIPLRDLSSTADSAVRGVILAIDYGKKRLGLALSDEHGRTSRPYGTWTRVNRRRDLARLRELVRLQGIRQIVVGLPLHLDGTPSEMSEEARSFAARVSKALGLPVELMDERLSSWQARQSLAAANSNERARRDSSEGSRRSKKTPLDEFAAQIILQDYLDRARARTEAGSRA